MLWRGAGAITAVRNGAEAAVPGTWGCRPFPAFSTKGACVAILNRGELPFFGRADDEGPGAVALYNKCRVVPTNEQVELAGLRAGDEIEARDGAFRGSFAGQYNGLFLVCVNGVRGAVPLDVTDPVLVRKLVRVVHREGRLQRAVVVAGPAVVVCEAAAGQCDVAGMHATPNGVAVLVGRAEEGFVFRPVADMMNNQSLFVLPECPPPISRFSRFGEFEGAFRWPETFCFDLVEDDKMRVALMIGSANDRDVGWNGRKCVRVRPTRTLWFRLFGFAFRKVGRDDRLLNFGNRPAGELFHPNHFACEGATAFPSLAVQCAHGAVGFTPLPGIVVTFLESLNEACLAAAEFTSPLLAMPVNAVSDFLYGDEGDGNDLDKTEKPPLIVTSRYS
jgi:hypothetical protein